jgi:DNA replication protein DnaC
MNKLSIPSTLTIAGSPGNIGPGPIRQPDSEKEMRERQHRMRVEQLQDQCDAPARHMNFKNPDVTGPWGEYLVKLTSKSYTGFLVGLCGLRGNGKTQLAVQLMKAYMEQERPALYTTAVGFFSRIKSSYRKDSEESEVSILDELRSPRLLVIDEIGKRGGTEWENNLLFELINCRYGDLSDTLLIDNRSKEEFEERLGPSLSSRMHETGGIILADWESFRK